MLATIRGTVIAHSPNAVIVEVQGLGYEVRVTAADMATVNTKVFLHLYEHLREDTHELYGFREEDAKQVFLQLLNVSGIGPKVAMQLLSVLGVSSLTQAIAAANSEVLQTVPGVGKRVAERIIVELKDKVNPYEGGSVATELSDTTYQALRQLGYSAQQAQKVVSQVPAGLKDEGERIKYALKVISNM